MIVVWDTDSKSVIHDYREINNPNFSTNQNAQFSIITYIFILIIVFFIFQPFKCRSPVNMENLPVNNRNGQAYGYTLYKTTITTGGLLKSGNNIRDRALVNPEQIQSE